MKYLQLPYGFGQRRLSFYLAMEEWAARTLPAGEYFFAWRVTPTVICGRNQDISKEVDLDYCRAEGIDVVRRRSGGGCVYADRDNWMFSYITATDDALADTFVHYTSMISAMLRSLGFAAETTGRNDIAIGGRKVAGNAFYHLPHRAIVHGTMLCNIDAERMSRAITPSRSKLESKAVQSVASRITSLSAEGLAMSVDAFGTYAVAYLTDGEITLTDSDVAAIDGIEKDYRDPQFLRIKADTAPLTKKKRLEDIGEIELRMTLDDKKRIREASILGDFFAIGNINTITDALIGSEITHEALCKSLQNIHTEKIIVNLTNKKLIELITS